MFGHRATVSGRGGGILRPLGSAGISLLAHLGIAGLLGLTTWAVGTQPAPILTEFRASIVQTPRTVGPSGGFRFVGEGDPTRPSEGIINASPETIEDLASLLAAEEALPAPEPETAGGGLDGLEGRQLRRSDVIGIGTGGAAGGEGPGAGLGRRSVAGGGPVGSLWGVGEGQRAKSIVYVLDRSGSMQDVFPLLKRELKKAVGTLDDDQSFNVLWFKARKYDELSKRLLPATMANKRKAFEVIDAIQPEGHTNPIDALRRAFGYQPDVLFLISDADFFPNNDRVVRLIGERNRRRLTTVNTILVVYDEGGGGGDRVEMAVRLFRAIAESNDGVYKRVRGGGGR